MQWLELCIQTCSAGIELVGERLTVLGYDSFIVDDQAEFETFLEQNKQYWDYVDQGLQEKMEGLSQIRLYLEDNAQAMETVRHLQDELQLLRRQNPGKDLGTLEIRISNLQDEDWENNWKQYYQPIPIGKRLVVVPQWLDPNQDPDRLPIRLDPGMIFGTGAHASTQMCMMALEENIHGGENRAGSGQRQRHPLHHGAGAGRRLRHRRGHRPQGRGHRPGERSLQRHRYRPLTAVTGDVIADQAMMERLAGQYDIVLAISWLM